MAGATVRIDYKLNDRRLRRALRRLSDIELDAAQRDIGEDLLNRHRARFAEQRAPDGTPWEPLTERYRARKKRNKDKILTYRGDLKDTLRYQIDGGLLRLGTDRIYGATHQFGDPDRNIPAREFLGLSEDDGQRVIQILQQHISRALAA